MIVPLSSRMGKEKGGISAPSNRHRSCSETKSGLFPVRGGIDTISFIFRWGDQNGLYPPEEDTGAQWSAISRRLKLDRSELETTQGTVQLFGSEHRTLVSDLELPGGIRFGITPRSYAVWVEGRAAAMLTGDRSNLDLIPPAFIRVAALRVAADICQVFGLPGGEWSRTLFASAEVGVRRLDIAAEIGSSAAYGLQLLRGFSHCSLAGQRKVDCWTSGGVVQTVNLREKSRKIRFRIYDKGVETGSCSAGERIRFERELRWVKADQPRIDEIGPSELRKWWRQGWEPWIGKDLEGHGVGVYPLDEAADRVLRAAETGEITWQSAERLCGALMVRRVRGEQWWKEQSGKGDAGWSRLRELKKLGIIPASTSKPIDLGEALETAEQGLAESPLLHATVPSRKEDSWGVPSFDQMLRAVELLDRYCEEDPEVELRDAQRRVSDEQRRPAA